MPTIAEYADECLREFLDAAHDGLKMALVQQYGQDWLEQGVRKYAGSRDYFRRAEEMLANPMRVVDMGREPEEMYGTEHIWNIINGNPAAFPKFHGSATNKRRSQEFLEEISELRHNLAHRRTRHILPKRNLIRAMDNCVYVLEALDSSKAPIFENIYDSLTSGTLPWGRPLDGQIPPSDEIYTEFVGRSGHLDSVSNWLFETNHPQHLVWGYGGSGKSALAYKFAHDIKEGGNSKLLATCWVSAKKEEFYSGETRKRHEDFDDLNTFVRAVWTSLYDDNDQPEPEDLIKDLKNTPILLVVDDLDTVANDADLSEYILYNLRNTAARVLLTSRHRVPGVRDTEATPFNDDELKKFVELRSKEHGTDTKQCIAKLNAIKSVTDGYPLFVDDLIRHAHMVGIEEAINHWQNRKGDAAREYSLRRQVEYLGPNCGNVLMVLALSSKPLTIKQISEVAGLTDDDSMAGIRLLEEWRLAHPTDNASQSSPEFTMNNNTKRLVNQTYKQDRRREIYAQALKSLPGNRIPEGMSQQIGRIQREVFKKVGAQAYLEAEQYLNEQMTGPYANSHDLFYALGIVHFRHAETALRVQSDQEKWDELVHKARKAFSGAYQRQSTSAELYSEWSKMELMMAEHLSNFGIATPDQQVEQWNRLEKVAEMGIERCGENRLLLSRAGYGANREAKIKQRDNYAYSVGAYGNAIKWYGKALNSPNTGSRKDKDSVGTGAIYRGLAIAYFETNQDEMLVKTLLDWEKAVERDPEGRWRFEKESRRMVERRPILQRNLQIIQMMNRLSS